MTPQQTLYDAALVLAATKTAWADFKAHTETLKRALFPWNAAFVFEAALLGRKLRDRSARCL